MTIFVASTEDDAPRRQKPHDDDGDPKEQRQRRDDEAKNSNNNRSKRKFPSWTKTQIPKWGTRICVPEWDDDEIITDDDDDDDENDNNNEDDYDDDDDDDGDDDDDDAGDVDDENGSCGCEYGSGGRVEDEAEADEYRNRNGWKGKDLCHSRHSPVRISHYAVTYGGEGPSSGSRSGSGPGGVGTVLTGLVHFTSASESHRGHCHGGSMTSVMDDVVGWTAFHVTGTCRPWSGYTAQVNVALKRPVSVGSYLTVSGRIVKWEGRKVWIRSKLVSSTREEDDDENENESSSEEIVHCTAEGLVILMKEDV